MEAWSGCLMRRLQTRDALKRDFSEFLPCRPKEDFVCVDFGRL